MGSSYARIKRDPSRLADYRCKKKQKREQEPALFLLYQARKRANRFGLPFDIVLEDVVIPEYCPVFGIKLEVGSGFRTDASPSLDRIRPHLGYVRGNVAVVSWKANRMKSNYPIEELIALARFYGKGH